MLVDLAAKQRIDLAEQRLATIAACLAQFWHVGFNDLVAGIHQAVASGVESLLDRRMKVKLVGVPGEGHLDLALRAEGCPSPSAPSTDLAGRT
jgi:Iap family predicted aminopeptidase